MERVYHHILVAVDGSEPSKNAFLKSIEVAKRHHATLSIMHAVDLRPYRGIQRYDLNFSKKAKSDAEVLIEERANEAESQNVEKVNAIVVEGPPKSALIKHVQNNTDIDLVICGATGINAVERMVLGSVADHVVRHARCDVLVVKNN